MLAEELLYILSPIKRFSFATSHFELLRKKNAEKCLCNGAKIEKFAISITRYCQRVKKIPKKTIVRNSPYWL